jgi:hypothetical protein
MFDPNIPDFGFGRDRMSRSATEKTGGRWLTDRRDSQLISILIGIGTNRGKTDAGAWFF